MGSSGLNLGAHPMAGGRATLLPQMRGVSSRISTFQEKLMFKVTIFQADVFRNQDGRSLSIRRLTPGAAHQVRSHNQYLRQAAMKLAALQSYRLAMRLKT